VTVDEIRARFGALDSPLAYFDGPGGTQVPDSVIDAIAGYLRRSNANLGGPFATSRASDALVTNARIAAAGFLGAAPDEVAFGANMTTLNFALSRACARGWRAGDEVVVTQLDHDANVSPWLELAHDLDLTVRFAEITGDCRLDLDQLASLLSERTRVVAFPWASNAVGTVTDVARVAALAHEAGALAWVDAVHYAPHGPIDVAAVGADVLLCSPYKFYGPHLGLAFARPELLERWRPYKVRPADDTPRRASLRDGHARPRIARRVRRRGRPPRRGRLGVRAPSRAPAGGAGSSPACPRRTTCSACRRWRAACPPSRSRTSASAPRRSPRASASAASRSGTATTTRSR